MSMFLATRMDDEEYVKERISRRNSYLNTDLVAPIMEKNADFFRIQSKFTNDCHMHEIIKYIMIEINNLSNVEGDTSFDTSEFFQLNRKIYNMILKCNRLKLKKYFEDKNFTVSYCDDNNLYPTISW